MTNNIFDDDFRNTAVNITVQEMGEILAKNMHEALDGDYDDVDDLIIHQMLFEIFRVFSANVMADMFPNIGDDKLEIEPKE